jgi:anti-sigma factor RsiW
MHPNDVILNDYVDDALATIERLEVDRHLETCPDCRVLVDDLRRLRRQIADLPVPAPPPRVWSRIERAIQLDRTAGTSTGRGWLSARPAWQWLAAAAALVLVATLVGVRLGPLARRAPGVAPEATPQNAALAQQVEAELRQAEAHYQKAIAGLEQIANAEKGALDPQTAAILQKNLSVIDQAISESRAALKAQPDSEPAQNSLLESFKTKIALLQDTVALINEMRKGNDAGAARIVSGLKQKG